MLEKNTKKNDFKNGGVIKPFKMCNTMVKPFTMEKKIVKPFEMNVKMVQSELNSKKLENSSNKKSVAGFDFDAIEINKQSQDVANTYLRKNESLDDVKNVKIITSTIESNVKKDLLSSGNFELYVQYKICNVFDTSEGERTDVAYKFTILVKLMDGQRRTFEKMVSGRNVKNPEWVLEATGGLATECTSRKHKKWFSEMVQKEIEKCSFVQRIYPSSGWRDTEFGKVYVYTGGAIGAEGMGISSIGGYSLDINRNSVGTYNTFKYATDMMKMCKSNRASTLIFLFVHASLLTTLFEESGFPINFVMGVIGITGSRKTSLCTTMAQLFNREHLKVDAEFTSTACGIEQTLSKYGDSPVIIDDFILGETTSEQAQMAKKLQTLVRFYGNRVSKERMSYYSRDSKKPYFPIRGGCILTGEQITGITSSISRMFITNIDRDEVRNDILSFYQENTWVLPTHAYDFILWCVENYNIIVEFIKQNFSNRRKIVGFRHPRYSEMYAVFCITAEIFLWYSKNRGFLDKFQIDNWNHDIRTIIINELRHNENDILLRDPSAILLLAFDEAIRGLQYEILQLTIENSARKDVIFEDSRCYYIQRKILGRMFSEYVSKYGINCHISNDSGIISFLEAQDVLETKINAEGYKERARKLPFQQDNHCRYLWINKERLTNKLTEISG